MKNIAKTLFLALAIVALPFDMFGMKKTKEEKVSRSVEGIVPKEVKSIDKIKFHPSGKFAVYCGHFPLRKNSKAVLSVCDLEGNSKEICKDSISFFATALDIHPSKNLILFGGRDGEIVLSDFEGENRVDYEGHKKHRIEYTSMTMKSRIDCAVFHPKIDMFATAEDSDHFKLWDFRGNCIRTVKVGDRERVSKVIFHPTEKLIITNGYKVRVWDLEGNLKKEFEFGVANLTFDPKTNLLLGSGSNKEVIIFDLDGKIKKDCEKHEYAISCIEVHPNKKLFASGSYDSTIRIYDLKGNIKAVCKGHKGACHIVKFHPEKDFIISSCDREIRLWNFKGECLMKFDDGEYDHGFNCLEIDPSGAFFLSATSAATPDYDSITLKAWKLP